MTVSTTLYQIASQKRVYIHTVGAAKFFKELRDITVAKNNYTHNNTEHAR